MSNKKDIFNKINQLERYATPKAKTHKQIQLVFQDIAEELADQHSAKAIFITIGINSRKGTTVEEEWQTFTQVMPKVVDEIDQAYPIAGMLVGIEMYQKRKGRPNQKSFKPHAHIVVFAYNEFMAAPKYRVQSQLVQLGLDVKVDDLAKPKDVANAMRYTIKGANDETVQTATGAYMGVKPATMWINTALGHNPLLRAKTFIQQSLTPINFVERDLYWKVPSVKKYNHEKYSAAEFLAKLCRQQRIGFYRESMLIREPGCFYTWQTWKPVNQFIDALAKQPGMPQSYKEYLLNNATWILAEGATDRNGAIHTIFPRVQMQPNLWELKHGTIYNFNTDTCETTNMTDFISCSKFVNSTYEELNKPPTQLIQLIDQITGSHKETARLLTTLGGLFHQLTTSRKKHRALWVYGTNNTYKTWLVAKFLEECFHEQLILRVPAGTTPYQFSRLRNAQEGVVFIDDFRSQGFKTNTAAFINIVDGTPTPVDEKYKATEVVEYKGHFAVTSNESIETSEFKLIDKKAIVQRFEQFDFQVKVNLDEQINALERGQWYALAVLANRYFLNKAQQLEA